MSDRTNDEKLRILQERLAQIKQKQDTCAPTSHQRKVDIKYTTSEDEIPKGKKNTLNLSWIKKSIIIGSVAYGIFYGYTNFNSLVSNFSAEKNTEESSPTQVEYELNLKGNNIAIIRSYEDESSAKALVNDLKVKGFKTDYFFLPSKSNSTKEVYQVFIGPYENEDETSQWIQNIDGKVAVLNLSKGRIYREMKSNLLIAKEKDEQEKIENDNKQKEQSKIKEAAKEKDKQEKIENDNKQKEQSKIKKAAKEKTEQEKIAKEKDEQIKLENDNKHKEQTKLQEAEKEQKKFKLQKQELENEKNQLQKDREQLEKDEKSLLTKRIQQKSKIIIKYTYDFKTTIKDEGVLIIKNNANYPIIKQNYAKIASQGGIEKILERAEHDLNTHGENIDGVYFEKNGTIVPIYNGKITEVSL